MEGALSEGCGGRKAQPGTKSSRLGMSKQAASTVYTLSDSHAKTRNLEASADSRSIHLSELDGTSRVPKKDDNRLGSDGKERRRTTSRINSKMC